MTTTTTTPRLSGQCRMATTPGMAWMHGRCSGWLPAYRVTGTPPTRCECPVCRHGAR